MKQRLFVLIFCTIIAPQIAVAQYSFTVTYSTSGNCNYNFGDGYGLNMDYLWRSVGQQIGMQGGNTASFSSKDQCESARLQLLSYSSVVSIYNCTLHITPTPCTGFGGNGGINLTGPDQGYSFYSTNAIDEILNWNIDDEQRQKALNYDYKVFSLPQQVNTGDDSYDEKRKEARDNENLFYYEENENPIIPYTNPISMAQARVLELAGLTSSEIIEDIPIAKEYITKKYNQRIMELNHMIILYEVLKEFIYIRYNNVFKERKDELEKKMKENLTPEEIAFVKNESELSISEFVLRENNDLVRDPEVYDNDKLVQLADGMGKQEQAFFYETIDNLLKNFEIEKKYCDSNYRHDINKLENINDLLNIKEGVDNNGNITYGDVTTERAYEVMNWFGNNGNELNTLFPNEFIDLFIENSAKIEIR